MAKYKVTFTSRTGEKVNPFTGSPSDSVAVYDDDDLNRRLKAAKDDPRDIEVDIRSLD